MIIIRRTSFAGTGAKRYAVVVEKVQAAGMMVCVGSGLASNVNLQEVRSQIGRSAVVSRVQRKVEDDEDYWYTERSWTVIIVF